MTARIRRPDRSFLKSGEEMQQAEDFHQRIRGLEALPYDGRFVCLIFPSTDAVVVGDDAAGFFLPVPDDLDELKLISAHAVVYTDGGSTVTVQIRNVTQAVDMLTTPITIDAGETTSYTATTPPEINPAVSEVATGDILVVDVIDAGGASGLVVILAISR